MDLKSTMGCFEAIWFFIWNIIKNSGVYRILKSIYGFISEMWRGSRIAGWFRKLHINEDALDNTFAGKVVRLPFTIVECLQRRFGKRLSEKLNGSGFISVCVMYLDNILALNTRFIGLLMLGGACGGMAEKIIFGKTVGVFLVIAAVVGVLFAFVDISITDLLRNSALVSCVCKLLGTEPDFKWYNAENVSGRGRYVLAAIVGIATGFVCEAVNPVFAPLLILGAAAVMQIMRKPSAGVIVLLFAAPILPTMMDVALALLCLASLFVNGILEENFKFKFDGLGFFIIVFIAVYLVAGFTSFVPAKSLSIWMIYFVFTAMYFVIINTANTEKLLNNMLTVFVISGFLVCLYGLAQYVFGWDTNQAWMDEEMFTDIKMRIYSTLGNPNVFGEYILLVLPVSVGLMWTRKNAAAKITYAGISVVMFAALILTFSRGCWLGLLFAAAIFITFAAGKLWGLGLIALPVLPMVLPDSIINRFTSIGNMEDSSTSYRVYIWMGTLAMIKDFWLSGIGMGQEAFTQVYPFYSYNGIVAPHSHNLFLQILVESGVVGIAVFLIIVALFLRRIMTGYQFGGKGDGLSTVMTAVAAGVCGFLLQGMFDNCFYNYRVMLVFWCVIALGRACVYVAKQRSEQTL